MAERFREGGPGVVTATIIAVVVTVAIILIILFRFWALVDGS